MIKKVKAPTIKDAMKMVKEQFGENAVILQTRKVRGEGLFDLLNPEMVEITAMVDGNDKARNVSEKIYMRTNDKQVKSARQDYLAAEIKSELKDLKETVMNMAEQVRYSKFSMFPKMFRYLVDDKGVEEEVAAEILHEITLMFSGQELQDKTKIETAFLKVISDYLKIDGEITLPKNRPKLIFLIGPTGVGKTTTITKLATHPDFYGKYRVALVTIDTYRVAAAAQLKTFAALADLALEIVYNPAEYRAAIERFQNQDVILIDTAGRSPLHSEHVKNLKAFMEKSMPDEVHLVLSVSMRADNLLDAVKNYASLPVNRVIFSKLDETPRIGNILNVTRKIKFPISFLTNGQSIPNDILFADKRFIANSIIT